MQEPFKALLINQKKTLTGDTESLDVYGYSPKYQKNHPNKQKTKETNINGQLQTGTDRNGQNWTETDSGEGRKKALTKNAK